MAEQIPQHISVQRMADKLEVCRATIYNMIKRGELPPLRKMGRNSRWRVEELTPYMEFSGENSPSAPAP